MLRKTWKTKARSGGVRRKALKEYLSIINLGNEDANSVQSKDGSVQNTNVKKADDYITQQKYEDIKNATGFFSEDGSVPDLSSVHNSSDESETSDDFIEYHKHLMFREKIKNWAIEKNISHTALKDLADIINELIPHILPNDPRTILSTPREINIKFIEGGQYWHNGIAKCLIQLLQDWTDVPKQISLNINFDGLPIFKSAKHEFWPILCNIFENQTIRPFVIGIYFGVGKPKDLFAYLKDFVDEMKLLLQEGINVNLTNSTGYSVQNIKIKIRCFICDSPARAYIKGVCNFNGRHGCLKCVTVGEYSHNSHTVVFPNTRCLERTNDGFRNKIYGAHHKIDSPLLSLPIDMVKDFPVGDSLHLIDLGIMKRLLVGWRDGNFGKHITKWRASDIEKVTHFLKQCRLPSEVHRAVRGLDTLAYWKASEFRSFFYYLSIIILPEVLRPDAFSHFLMLYCGIIICSCQEYQPLLPLAEELLRYFVEHYKDFYGAEYITSNVHNLLHVTNEVKMYGPLHTFNAYPFENQLFMIKKMLRTGKNPLSQVANRLAEDGKGVKSLTMNQSKYPFVSESNKRYKVLNLQHFKLSSQKKDRFCLTTNDEIVEINCIINVDTIEGYKLNNMEDVFEHPVKSSRFNIYKCKLPQNPRRCTVYINPKKVKCKLVCVEHNDFQYFIPLLHTL